MGAIPKGDPPPASSVSLDPQRRLWFDYLAKLNDRSLEASNKSGATSWVLFGIAVAIMYRCVPRIPSFLGSPSYVKAALTVFLLELNMFVTFIFFIFGLIVYPGGIVERRLKPERARRAERILTPMFIVVWGILNGAQLWVGVKFVGPNYVRWTLICFGLFWEVNILFAIVKKVSKRRKAKARHVQLPEFYGLELGTDLGALLLAAFHLPLVIISAASLLIFLNSLDRFEVSWILPLGAATQFLALCAIAAVLFYRGLSVGEKSAYLALERAIVVENLDPSEIRTRFVTQLFGSEVGEWMKGIVSRLAEVSEKMKRTTSMFDSRFAEIEAIDGQYSLERRGRAEKLAKELADAANEHKEAVGKVALQLKEYVRFALSREERELLKVVVEQLTVSVEVASKHATLVTGALEKLQPFLTKDS